MPCHDILGPKMFKDLQNVHFWVEVESKVGTVEVKEESGEKRQKTKNWTRF